jgi:hypothetical protein
MRKFLLTGITTIALFGLTNVSEAAQSICFLQDTNGVITTCPVDANGVPIVSSGASAASATNSSSTITTGGTFQTISAASTSRKSLEFTNICNVTGNCTATTNYCYIFIAASGTPSTANSVPVPPGAMYVRSMGAIPTDAIQATCAGNGDKYALKVQ